MAEAVGLTASVVTLGEIGLKLAKLVGKLRDAPYELLTLSNEVTDFRFLFTEIEKLARERPDSQILLSNTLDIANLRIKDVQKFLKGIDTTDTKIVDRVAWVFRHKSKIGKLQSELRDTRLQLSALLNIGALSTMRRMEHLLEDVQLTVSTSSQLVQNTQDIVIERLQGSEDIDQGYYQLQTSLGGLVYDQKDLQVSQPAFTTMTIRSHVSLTRNSPCRCKCHAKPQTRTLATRFLGTLFLGYCGVPFLASKCSEDGCQAECKSRSTNLALAYYFPSWMLSKAIHVTYTSSPLFGPEFCLRVRNIISLNSPLFLCAQEGDLDGMKSLFQSGLAHVNDSDDSGSTVLLYAFDFDRDDMYYWLLQVGADPLLEDCYGMSVQTKAWTFAVSNRKENCCTLMDDVSLTDISILDEEWQLPELHRVLFNIVPTPSSEAILSSSAEINATDTCGRTALWWAAFMDDEHALRTLLEHGADPNISDDLEGKSPLQCAAREPFRIECMKMLLKYGADAQALSKKNRSIFHNWAEVGHSDGNEEEYNQTRKSIGILTGLGVSLDTRDYQGYTAVVDAVYWNTHNVLEALLECGADYTIHKDDGYSILHVAANKADVQTLEILSAHGLPGIDLDLRWTGSGETALEFFEDVKFHKSPGQIRGFYRMWREVSLKVRRKDGSIPVLRVIEELGSGSDLQADEDGKEDVEEEVEEEVEEDEDEEDEDEDEDDEDEGDDVFVDALES